jgi:histidyl-tRNA synthetase
LKEDAKEYFMKVLEYLDELDIPYVLRPTLVRGLDYYTDTVFELYQVDEEGRTQSALCGGGRYDLLTEQLGGQPTPAIGFALGLERVMSVLRKRAGEEGVPDTSKAPIYFAQLGVQGRQKALALIEDLRRNDIFVHHNLGKTSLKGQLEAANKFGVTHSVILGQKEVQDGTVIIRDMESGIQEIVDQKKLRNALVKILK